MISLHDHLIRGLSVVGGKGDIVVFWKRELIGSQLKIRISPCLRCGSYADRPKHSYVSS